MHSRIPYPKHRMCGVFFSLHFSLVSVVVLTCNELHFIRTKTSVIVCVSHFEQFTTASKSSRHASDVFFPNFSLVCCCYVFSVALVFFFIRSILFRVILFMYSFWFCTFLMEHTALFSVFNALRTYSLRISVIHIASTVR